LLPPAADVVRGLRPESPPSAYLQMLDSAFGTVEDGEELFAQFLNTLQDLGEKPSTYLHRLRVALNLAVKRGGVAPEEVDKHLLKQFRRGCWDNALLSTLQLEQKKDSPPSFPELLLMLRTEEDRQQTKASRMKKTHRCHKAASPGPVSGGMCLCRAKTETRGKSQCHGGSYEAGC